jgi:1,4-alpha-glucan branching enzyme
VEFRIKEFDIDGLRLDAASENLGVHTVTVRGIKGASYQIRAEETGRPAELLEFAVKAEDRETVKAITGFFSRTRKPCFSVWENFLLI